MKSIFENAKIRVDIIYARVEINLMILCHEYIFIKRRFSLQIVHLKS